jgi:hypothetical protein
LANRGYSTPGRARLSKLKLKEDGKTFSDESKRDIEFNDGSDLLNVDQVRLGQVNRQLEGDDVRASGSLNTAPDVLAVVTLSGPPGLMTLTKQMRWVEA